MRSVIALTNGLTSLQLALAGMRVDEVNDVREAEERLAKIIDDKTARVVIVQEEYRSKFTEWFTERLRRHKGQPLIVYCPAFEEEETNVDAYLTAVLKPAIGYEIRLE